MTQASESPGVGTGAGDDAGATERSQYNANAPEVQALAEHRLARWADVGGATADLDAARVAFPDLPDERGAALADWLAAHPEVADAVSRADPLGPSPDAPPFKLRTGYDILTTVYPDPVCVIPGLLPVGLCVFGGRPKIGKSWLALQIAQSVAAGGVAFGEQIETGSILYLALEDTERRLQDRMRKQSWRKEYAANLDIMPLAQFVADVGDLRNGGSERLSLQIQRAGYRLAIVDTLSLSIYGDQSDVSEMTQALTPLREMAHAHNCAVLLVDHHRKTSLADPDAVSDILGSTAKAAVADSIWGIYRERGKAGAKLAVTGREIEERTLALTWDRATGCWQCEGDADELALTERRREIIDALAGMGRASLKEIADVVEQPKSHTHNRLQDLFNASLVVRIEQGKRVYYELP